VLPEDVFAGHPDALALFEAVRDVVEALGPVETRVSRTQVAFRRRRGFAYVWRPGMWLRRPAAEAVLSIALGERIDSSRFKEVVHPSPQVWMHHLELNDPGELDEDVEAWLARAYDEAG
jgi:hypothetical protein